ncbi:MAG: hypothetical protein M3O86_06730, partial [Actinomycetota bacterium]|nr:hypothetical protein [Actinomycetota bacterium]
MSHSTATPVAPEHAGGRVAPDLSAGRRGSGARLVAQVVGDALAVLLVAAVVAWFAGEDGGRDQVNLAQAAVLGLVALPLAARELRRLPARAAHRAA